MNGKPWAVSIALLLAAGCGGGEVEQTAAERAEALRAARADSTARAETAYDAAAFDTISWPDDGALWERGGVVWSFSCQKCHGADGKGGGEVAAARSIAVSDLTTPDWPWAGDIPGIRHQIFVGHDSEMPNWGLVGLSYRDVDAAAHYIDELLRPTTR